ncbi:MAG: alpha/beta hydrolase [Vicinamibacterales bacterium]
MIWRTPKYTGPERRKTPRKRRRPFRTLLLLLWLAVAGYGAGVIWLMTQETRIVFQAVKTMGDSRPPFAYQQIDLPRSDGARQFAWVMPGGDVNAPWVVYLHGSPSTIASGVNIAHYAMLRDLGLNVIAPEYRGFAGLEGSPTEAGLSADAAAAYEYLRRERQASSANVVLYGWSLGSAVAIDLATKVPIGAIVLEGAPASIVEMTQRRYPFFPVRLLMRNRFESIAKVGRIPSPMLFLHSAEDAVVPIDEGRRLFAAAGHEKEFVEVRGGHVHAIDEDGDRIATAVRAFLEEQGALSPPRSAAEQVRALKRNGAGITGPEP